MAGWAKRRALLFVSGYCASCLRTNLLDGLDKWALPLTVNRLWHVYNQVIWVLVFCFSPMRPLTFLHFWKGYDGPRFPLLFIAFVYQSYVEWTSQSWWYWMLEILHPFHSSSTFFWRGGTRGTGVSVSYSQQTYIAFLLLLCILCRLPFLPALNTVLERTPSVWEAQ